MNNLLNWVISPDAPDYTSNSGYIYKRVTTTIVIVTLAVIAFIWFGVTCNKVSGIVTFILVAGASAAGGAAFGFLFGLPRSNKFRFVAKDETEAAAKDNIYGDNTNLEEVSDWVTKIIVGLTLIKVQTILTWIDNAATNIDHVFREKCTVIFDAYVMGYCTIILYFLAGAGLCYLWARTNLSLILTRSRMSVSQIEKKQLMTQVQTLANEELRSPDGKATYLGANVSPELRAQAYPTEGFKNVIESVYNAKKVYDKTDIQKNRWGGKAKVGNYTLKATYVGPSIIPELHIVNLSVQSENLDSPLTGEVAFFLHDTFPSEVVYTVAANNKAEISFQAFEAFVAGARLQNNDELELDLNKVEGFPKSFYWTE
jgi:hypothetical protein